MQRFRRSTDGFTFVELVVATAVMLILASAALPLARVSIRRQRETDLHRTLRELRSAIDKFKENADAGRIVATELPVDGENYPISLEQLVNGVAIAGDATGHKLKFLRRIPIDPMTGRADWGFRSQEDASDAKTWGGQNIYEVYSKAEGVGLDGTKYRDW